MINNPHALYYNGELIGIITNPDPFGNMGDLVDTLSPDQGAADAITIPVTLEQRAKLFELIHVELRVPEVIDPAAEGD